MVLQLQLLVTPPAQELTVQFMMARTHVLPELMQAQEREEWETYTGEYAPIQLSVLTCDTLREVKRHMSQASLQKKVVQEKFL